MSRYGVTYKPGGAIAKPLEMTLKMQHVKSEENCTPCAVKPTGLFWYNPVTANFDSTAETGYVVYL